MPFTPVNFGQVASNSNASTASPTPRPQPQSLSSKILIGAANVGKDAFNTLIGTPATRLGQVVGNAIAPALGITPQQVQHANEQPLNLPLGLGTVPPQQGGLAGAEQIGGQALKSASYLVPGATAEGVVGGGVVKGAIQGAKIGAASGALGGAGNAMSTGGSASDVATGALTGAGTGALAGGTLGGATGLAGKILSKGGSSYETNLANATSANDQAGATATNSIHEASNTITDVNQGLGSQFAQAPKIISQVDPGARVILPSDFVDKLNQLKDTKAFSLPDYIRNPEAPTDIKNIGSGERVLRPEQAQDLISQLNDLKFNSKGDVVVNQQTSNLVSEAKTLAQKYLGHVTDAQGNSVWGSAYQDYTQGKDAMEAMSNLIPIKKSAGAMLDPTEVNNSVNKMMKMMETPQGTQALMRGNADFKNATGYDLLHDPIGTIGKLADSNEDFAKALKGNYGHQFVQGLKNPTLASRRVVFAITSLLGITAMATAFRKQIGGFITGQ